MKRGWKKLYVVLLLPNEVLGKCLRLSVFLLHAVLKFIYMISKVEAIDLTPFVSGLTTAMNQPKRLIACN